MFMGFKEDLIIRDFMGQHFFQNLGKSRENQWLDFADFAWKNLIGISEMDI